MTSRRVLFATEEQHDHSRPVITVDATQLEVMLRNWKDQTCTLGVVGRGISSFYTGAHTASLEQRRGKLWRSKWKKFRSSSKKLDETRQSKSERCSFSFWSLASRSRAANLAAATAGDSVEGSNGPEVVRYIRRRKFGHKRRSIFVKRRMPVPNHQKANKNDSLITHDDSCTQDTIMNNDDEHSQEYVSRRRISTINESNTEQEQPQQEEEHDEEEEEEQEATEVEEKKKEEEPVAPANPVISTPKKSSKPTAFKQLKLDQFLKAARPIAETAPPDTNEKIDSNSMPLADADKQDELCEQTPSITRGSTRNPHLASDNDCLPISAEDSDKPSRKCTAERWPVRRLLVFLLAVDQDSSIRQTSEGGESTVSDTESATTSDTPDSVSPIDQASSNPPPPSDPIESSGTNGVATKDQPNFSRESSVTTTIPSSTPSSLSDILANRMLSSSSSTLNTDDETKIARIESQLKTSAAEAASHNDTTEEISSINAFESTIKPVEFIDDEAPPSLTSPTSMIVSQSNHYNYSTRGKQQSTPPVPQTITINNFNTSTNMTYNFGHTAYPYTYPPAPSIDMPPFYYPPGSSMNYMPYYPPGPYPNSPSSMYPSDTIYNGAPNAPSMYYPSNGVHPIPFNGNGTSPYVYPTAQPSSTASTTHRHWMNDHL